MSCRFRSHAAGAGNRDRPRRCDIPASNAGFTVVELVLVIVIVGILGAIAGPRFFDNSTFQERAYYDELASAIRYAQKVAVASGCRVRVSLAASTYELRQQTALGGHCDTADSVFPLPVLLPDGQAVSGIAPSGVTAVPPLVVLYDAQGRTNLVADQTINIGSRSLQIEAESGLVITP